MQAVDTALAGGPFAAEQNFTTPSFVNSGVSLPGVSYGALAWGDYDNDGRLDFLLTGYDESSDELGRLYHQKSDGSFEDVSAIVDGGLPQVQFGSVAWGDFDNEGRLDFLLTGCCDRSDYVSRLYHQTSAGRFEDVSATIFNNPMPGV